VEVVPTAASVSASGGEDEMPTCRRAVQLCDAKCTLLDGETNRAVRRESHAARAKSRLSRKLRCEAVPIISMAVPGRCLTDTNKVRGARARELQ